MVGPPHSAHQLSAPDPRVDLTSGGSERKSVTETDLITAGGSDENVELPQTQPVNSDKSSSQGDSAADATNGTSTAETAPTADVASGDRPASLSSMVLPELRALAKQIGVAGASGMRKGELVAAIRERRGESNGRPQDAATQPTPLSLQPTPRPRRARPSSPPRSRLPSAVSVAVPLAGPVPPAARTRTSRSPTSRKRPTPKV